MPIRHHVEALRKLSIVVVVAACGSLAVVPAASADVLDDPVGFVVGSAENYAGKVWWLVPPATAPDAYRPNGTIDVPDTADLDPAAAAVGAAPVVDTAGTDAAAVDTARSDAAADARAKRAFRRCRRAAAKKHRARAKRRALRRCRAAFRKSSR